MEEPAARVDDSGIENSEAEEDEGDTGGNGNQPSTSDFDRSNLKVSMEPLACPACSSTFNGLKQLVNHTSKYHPGITELDIDKSVDALGVITCRICGTIRESTQSAFVSCHLAKTHGVDLLSYLGKYGQESIRPSDEDRRIAADIRCMNCPKCPAGEDSSDSFIGLRTLRHHYKVAHKLQNKSRQTMSFIADVAADLGLGRCDRCGFALATWVTEEIHQRHCRVVKYMRLAANESKQKGFWQFQLSCHLCQMKFQGISHLKKHYERTHAMTEDETLPIELRLSASTGVCFCRICGSLRERQYSHINNHLKQCHLINLKQYLTRQGIDAFDWLPEEERLSEAVRNLACPICQGKGDLGSLKALQVHMLQKHGVSVQASYILTLCVNQLGSVVKCRTCKTAVVAHMEENHAQLCGINSTTRNKGRLALPLPLFDEKPSTDFNFGDLSEPIGETMQDAEESSASAAAIDDSHAFDAIKFSCPICASKLRSKGIFHTHVKRQHPEEDSDRLLERSLMESGLSACKICFSVSRRVYPDIEKHVRSHCLELTEYVSKFGKTAFEQNEDEVFASNAAKRISCPKCDEVGIAGIDEFKRHLTAVHERTRATWPEVLRLLQPQLRLGSCVCKTFVFPEHEQQHLKACETGGPIKFHGQYGAEKRRGAAAGTKRKSSDQASTSDKRPARSEMSESLDGTVDYDDGAGGNATEIDVNREPQQVTMSGRVQPSSSSDESKVELRKAMLKLSCPFCPDQFKSVAALTDHTSSKHKKGKDSAWLRHVLSKVESHSCGICKETVRKDYESVEIHVATAHPKVSLDKYVKDHWGALTGSNDGSKASSDCNNNDDDDDDVVVLDEDCGSGPMTSTPSRRGQSIPGRNLFPDAARRRANDGANSSSSWSLVTSNSPVLKCNGSIKSEPVRTSNDAAIIDGCKYVCPRCKTGPFHSLLAVTGHVKRKHSADFGLLLSLKQARVEERKTECKICHEVVVLDQMELGYHVWAMHGMVLDAYIKLPCN